MVKINEFLLIIQYNYIRLSELGRNVMIIVN